MIHQKLPYRIAVPETIRNQKFTCIAVSHSSVQHVFRDLQKLARVRDHHSVATASQRCISDLWIQFWADPFFGRLSQGADAQRTARYRAVRVVRNGALSAAADGRMVPESGEAIGIGFAHL